MKKIYFLLATLVALSETAVLRRKDNVSQNLTLDKYGFQPLCVSCTGLITVASLILKFDVSEPVILKLATIFCTLFAKQPWAVCDGISSQFKDEFFYVFRRLADRSPSEICGIILPDCADSTDPSESRWRVAIPPKPKRKRIFEKNNERISASISQNLYVLQLTDLHIDFQYQYSSEAHCDGPVCCRESIPGPRKAAGYWGSVGKCDIPYRTVEHMLSHIKANHTIDMVLMTGDYINHVDWEYTVEEHLSVLRKIHALVQNSFPSTPIYWALGNHEGVPVNSFAPHTVDERFWPTWLYKEFKVMSGPWLSVGSDDSLLKRGSYSTKIMDGLRLISLNSGFCETTNFFLYLNQSDPDSSMSWFVNELYEAEKEDEQVYVLAHIPPGSSECLEGWAFNYYRVIQRFESTIAAQFFGHDHSDYFTVFYEDMHNVSSKPIGVGYAAPSVTTYAYQNPAYRIYEIDPYQKFKIVDFTTYFADLEKTNPDKPPVWEKLYSAREAFKMDDLSPLSWNYVIQKLYKSEKKREQFYKYAFRNFSPHCDASCQMQLMCNLRMGHHNSTLYCPT